MLWLNNSEKGRIYACKTCAFNKIEIKPMYIVYIFIQCTPGGRIHNNARNNIAAAAHCYAHTLAYFFILLSNTRLRLVRDFAL